MRQKDNMKQYTRRHFLVAGTAAILTGCSSRRQVSTEAESGKTIVNELVLIKGGAFVMGSETKGDHSPAHQIRLGDFYLDRYEVTNAHYHAFCQATDHRLPEFWGMERYRSGPRYPDHPVVGVSWHDALTYAKWCGKRLPTEAEWEYGARGGLSGKQYPNGDSLSPADGNYTASKKGYSVQVGSYPANGYGLFDMQGNVVEWVHDRYGAAYYAQSPATNPQGPSQGRFRVIRGGGWHSNPNCNKVYWRNALPANWVDFSVGFRCAKDTL